MKFDMLQIQECGISALICFSYNKKKQLKGKQGSRHYYYYMFYLFVLNI